MKSEMKSKKGFTLIELSIVLVIIGLIVGGVLVGQDLIKAAELRSTVSQIQKYETAVNTFRLKYNGIPGDLSTPDTFFTITNVGTDGCGDGDGLVEGVSACGTVPAGELMIAGENTVFWYQLSQAGMVDGNYTVSAFTTYNAAPSDTTIPAAKAGAGRVVPGAAGGKNYFVIGAPGTPTAGNAAWTAGFTPTEAYQLDSKVDDGVPDSGIILAVSETAPDPDAASAGNCYASSAYALNSSVSDALECNISWRASF